MITWHYRAPVTKRDAFKIRHIKRNIDGDAVAHSHKELKVLTEFKGSSDQLSEKLKTGFGGQISVEYTTNNGADDISFNYAKASFPKQIDFSKLDPKKQATQKPAGYVRVYSRYWEQLTMNLRALISLAGQARIGGRKVLEPRVKDSVFDLHGHPLGIYFDVKHFNNILAASDYANLANQDEYDSACSSANASHVIIHFLYPQKGVDFTKDKMHLSDQEYNAISSAASKSGWTECTALTHFVKGSSKSKQYCVDPKKFTKWEKLEKDVVKGARCLTICAWRGIGSGFRTFFSESEYKIKSRDIQFALKPPWDILKEAKMFKNKVISDRYIAVQVRGERVVIPHNLDRLRSCLRLLAEVVGMLKQLSDIKQVLIASDMSDFGSGSWRGSLKGEVYNDNTLKDLHSFLISSTGGIEYKPAASDHDRGAVALVEMELIARAQHLITIGTGSFQEWIKAKFLEQHRNDGLSWSLITMCSK